jgi:ubiquinol-cytochrome c reductase cytochrome b subunit
LTGYVSQQNFDAQWIATQAKDGLNAAGVGAFFNVTNFGQMYSYHVLLLPLAVVALVAAHILLVRKHGIVPPFDLSARVDTSGLASGVPSGPAAPQVAGNGAAHGSGTEPRPVAELPPAELVP